MEYTLEEFVLENLEARNRGDWASITETRSKGEGVGGRFAARLDKFVYRLSEPERNKIFDGIVKTIAIPTLKMSNHFFARMVERYAALDLGILCARIRQCVESALKHKKERVKKDDMVVVIAPEERTLITLYTRLI
ncbi:hypothetical protein FACS1894167_04940 [Synergistales bacterium]|nr:hypothetical protein FACS1894167_04940 [Synergistales bacterium]